MIIPLHLPRRHRRPLLFPPGLLTLAWLLWLGCVALSQIPLESTPILALFSPQPPRPGLYTNRVDPALTATYVDQSKMPVIFISSAQWGEYFFTKQLDFILPSNSRETPFKGIEYRFARTSTTEDIDLIVSQLVKRLDLFFWLDTRKAPVRIYLYNEPAEDSLMCKGIILPTIDWPKLSADEVEEDSITCASLLQSDWRYSTLLLLLLASISAIRLYRQHRIG
jgi:hypothetical protein